ncbi:hypothetical protein JCM19236_6184 [Vibrio sp. JCM 19236]|nr:hypothetical protein JCM19236_6184 [Vibrio sp. JCM 19236]
MKASKTAIAVAISSVFLFGCDFDVGSENNTSGGGNDGNGGGGLPPVENAQNYVQIQDSSIADTGILRLKTSESKSDTAVDNIPVGFLTVDLTYQDNTAINGENAAANAIFKFTQLQALATHTFVARLLWVKVKLNIATTPLAWLKLEARILQAKK